MSAEPRKLKIGNKPPEIYVNSANTIASKQGFVIISGFGQALISTARLANILERNFHMKITAIVLDEQEVEARTPDPKDPDAIKHRNFIGTGRMVWKPRLSITLEVGK